MSRHRLPEPVDADLTEAPPADRIPRPREATGRHSRDAPVPPARHAPPDPADESDTPIFSSIARSSARRSLPTTSIAGDPTVDPTVVPTARHAAPDQAPAQVRSGRRRRADDPATSPALTPRHAAPDAGPAPLDPPVPWGPEPSAPGASTDATATVPAGEQAAAAGAPPIPVQRPATAPAAPRVPAARPPADSPTGTRWPVAPARDRTVGLPAVTPARRTTHPAQPAALTRRVPAALRAEGPERAGTRHGTRRRHGLDEPRRPRGARRRRRTALVLTAVAAGLVALPTVGAAAVDRCRWQVTAQQIVTALTDRAGDTTRVDDLPAECAGTRPAARSAPDPAPRPRTTTAAPAPATTAAPAPAPTTAPPPPKPAPAPAPAASGDGPTAAARYGWGTPVRSDDFTGGLSGWGVYDGPGHAGNGRRTPAAASVANGILTITGDSDGNTAGMAWRGGQKYGRWEGRVRAPASDPSYNALLLLWPDAENFPVGGEIDFMEMSDHTRQSTDLFLHYGRGNNQVQGTVDIDATQWHNWAVEWTPQGVTAYVDGRQWYHTANTSILPPGPMHLCIQLDWFPKGGSARTSQMQVDWVRQYAL